MPKHSTIVQIEDSKIANKEEVRALFSDLKDGRYLVELTTANKRTNPQNRYYWGLVIPMIQKGIEDMGTELTKEETHEMLKAKFNYSELVNTSTGECELIPRTTSTLTTVQFMGYLEKIQRFAAEFLGLVIPDPGQQVEIDFA
jgi:hypothetical protein